MSTLFLAIGTALAYLLAYHTYGTFIASKIFKLDNRLSTPAHAHTDNVDFIPTKTEILFGHHYTSIAGTGPIVGPAIGIIWGWVPALLWVLLGSIFMGAVHDFGAIVISMRNRGRSIGDIASEYISKRVRTMFLAIIVLALLIVIAIFCLVIAKLFTMFPQAVFPIWFEIPIALWLGHMIYTKRKPPLRYSLLALIVLYLSVIAGAYFPISLPSIGPVGPVVIWTVILLVYAYIASILPVWKLLQPRDYINGHELFVALGLLALGVIFSRPTLVAPAINPNPVGAPSMWPFLFITIACGAVSGFHSLVGSGTTSKQINKEKDAKIIGYGGMLLEGMLAVFALIAVGAGIGLLKNEAGLEGFAAWNQHYASWAAAKGLGAKVGAFVSGSANMLTYIGIPLLIGKTIMGVFVASFAGTTLDTATRLQRYALSELATSIKLPSLANRYIATALAVITAGALALWDGKGAGGLLLWPLFGATNQLLASLALLVLTTYLARRGSPRYYTAIPFIFMTIMTGWAMFLQLGEFLTNGSWHLLIIGMVIVILEIWMIVEAILVLFRFSNQSPQTQT